MNNFPQEIKPDEKVCFNCEHLGWLVGVGQGLKCLNPNKEIKNQPIQHRRHTCELFEFKKDKNG